MRYVYMVQGQHNTHSYQRPSQVNLKLIHRKLTNTLHPPIVVMVQSAKYILQCLAWDFHNTPYVSVSIISPKVYPRGALRLFMNAMDIVSVIIFAFVVSEFYRYLTSTRRNRKHTFELELTFKDPSRPSVTKICQN